jgi:hypothetical protein
MASAAPIGPGNHTKKKNAMNTTAGDKRNRCAV